jgi:hypothetical protein
VRLPGQLTPGWRLTTLATWALAFVAWSGVWKASRELGLATWWLGPISAPRPLVVMLVPFVAPAVMGVLALNNARRLPWLGLGAAAIAAVIGIVDLSYVRRLGIAELVIAAAAGVVSAASLTGMYRAAAPATGADGPAEAPAPSGTTSTAG